MEGLYPSEFVSKLQVLHFLPGKVVRPEGKRRAAGGEEFFRPAVAVNASCQKDCHIFVAFDEFPAGRPGQLGIGKEINISSFNGLLVPFLENGVGLLRDFLMNEIFPVSQPDPVVIDFFIHIDGMFIFEKLVEIVAHGKAPAIMGHRHKEGAPGGEEFSGLLCHMSPKVRAPFFQTVGRIDDSHVGFHIPNPVTAVEGIIFPIIAGIENGPAFHGDLEPHRPGAVARPSPVQGKSRLQLQLRRRGIENHRIFRFVGKLAIGLVAHEYRSVKAVFDQVFDGPGMIFMGMADKQVFCAANLFGRKVRQPVQSVRRRSGIQDKSMTVSFHIEAVPALIPAASRYIKLHSIPPERKIRKKDKKSRSIRTRLHRSKKSFSLCFFIIILSSQ